MPVTTMREWREMVTSLRSGRGASPEKGFGTKSVFLGYPTLRDEAKALRPCCKSLVPVILLKYD